MKILGVSLGHDLGACLLGDGERLCAIEEERLNRIKHGTLASLRELPELTNGSSCHFPWASVRYCLDSAGLALDDIDVIALPGSARPSVERQLCLPRATQCFWSDSDEADAHHLRHALTAHLGSPFSAGAALVCDGDGSMLNRHYEAESGYLFDSRDALPKPVFKNRYAADNGEYHGLGWFYEIVSILLGFRAHTGLALGQPGKTMGLAAYGQPKRDWGNWIHFEQGATALDFSEFYAWLREQAGSWEAVWVGDAPPMIADSRNVPQQACDVAATAQFHLEAALVHLAIELRLQTGAAQLSLAGGVALNSVANAKIARRAGYRAVFAQPAANDAGEAMGVAMHAHVALQSRGRSLKTVAPMRHAFGGRRYSRTETLDAAQALGLTPTHEFQSLDEAAADAATRLTEGYVLGWYWAGSEMGPRALGHRSILADPRSGSMRSYINRVVKRREPFRPLAPAVLEGDAASFFEIASDARFMLEVASLQASAATKIPAVSHFGGSARVQVVNAETSPELHALLRHFKAQTGLPVLLNTSFNDSGQPIVERPIEALALLLVMPLDALYLDNFVFRPPRIEALIVSRTPGWQIGLEADTSRHDAGGHVGLVVRCERTETQHRIASTTIFASSLMNAVDTETPLVAAMTAPMSDLDRLAGRHVLRVLYREGVLRITTAQRLHPSRKKPFEVLA